MYKTVCLSVIIIIPFYCHEYFRRITKEKVMLNYFKVVKEVTGLQILFDYSII